MRLHFSPKASTDLENVGDGIAVDNPIRARTFVRELVLRCQKIADAPHGMRERPEIAEGVRLVPFGNYVIIYRVLGDIIRIERIVWAGRVLKELLD